MAFWNRLGKMQQVRLLLLNFIENKLKFYAGMKSTQFWD